MALTDEQKDKIKNLLRDKLDNKLKKYARETTSMPFLSRLMQDPEKVASYSFIHSIATTLGMSIYEEVSKIVTKSSAQEVERQIRLEGTLSQNQKQVIGNIVNELRNRSREANREKEVEEVLNADPSNGKEQNENKIVDFYMKKEGDEYLFEIKTVKPNIDVFTKSKQKLLEWVARKQKKVHSILAFPYNPYYPEPYSRFTEQGVMEHGTEFLVGKEYWDFIGGEGTYEEILKIFDEVGKDFREKIQNKIEEVSREKMED